MRQGQEVGGWGPTTHTTSQSCEQSRTLLGDHLIAVLPGK